MHVNFTRLGHLGMLKPDFSRIWKFFEEFQWFLSQLLGALGKPFINFCHNQIPVFKDFSYMTASVLIFWMLNQYFCTAFEVTLS